MLDSRNTQEDRDEARRFNKSLNDLMEQKAAQYHERKGVGINFTQALWYSSDEMRPYLLSRIDCYHPNRLGQMKLAHLVWNGHNPNFTPTDAFFAEGFDSHDWCNQEYTTWDSCWYDGGDGQCGDEFICNIDASGWFKFGKESSKDEDHWIARDVRDLSGKSEVWAYFKHKRDHFDKDKSDWVAFDVWNGSNWVRVEKFKKIKDKIDKFSHDVKEKIDYIKVDTTVSSIKFKYRTKSILEKSKEFLKGYDSLDDSFLLPEDSDDIQSSLSKMLADERKKDADQVEWESISTYKHIKEKI